MDALDAGGDVADFAGAEDLFRGQLGAERAHFGDVELLIRAEGTDDVPHLDAAVFDAHEEDDALVIIVIAVEDECLERSFGVAVRRRDLPDDLF